MNTFKKYSFAAIVILMVAHMPAWAQDATAAAAEKVPASQGESYLFWSIATILLFLVLFMASAVLRAASIGEKASAPTGESLWQKLDRTLFTKAIPVEKEKDHLLDHDYDGIQELDNSLPPWWKWGFYVTIVVAVIYMVRFHVLGTGPAPEEEYKAEMSLAAAQIEAYRQASGEMIDEKTVTMADAAGIAAGAKIYAQSCMACHGGKGEGGVGPNLTDDFWLHGGSVNDVFKTIKIGVPEKGMQAWEKMFSPTQLKNLASYIKSLRGTNPPNGKAPQGAAYKEPSDAVAAK